MADDKLAQKRNTGPDPMEAEANQYREKTYEADNPPKKVTEEKQKLPEKDAEAKVGEEMPEAVDEVKKKI